jgi:serine/threonine-protein kinase
VTGRYFGVEWSVIYPELTDQTARRLAAGITTEVAVWWVLATALSTGASVVIYGLRRRIHDAEQLGQYRLEEKIGEGGMGAVYRASHAFLRRPTAVKLLPPDRAGADNLRRFEQEVQLTASLTHPHTVTIFDYGHTSDGLFYYAMEYIDGLTLTDLVTRSGAQDEGRVVHLMRQAASALVEAHGIGLVHRDIKPGNIMVHLLHPHGGGEDFVKVLDFGLVKEVRREGGIQLTNEANLAGTPQYMAPESITSPDSVDGRADLYALGAVGYYLLTGTHVFTGESIVEVCGHHLHSDPEPLSSRLGKPVAPALEETVLSCLAKDPSRRPQTAWELEQRLADCAGIDPWTTEDAQRWWSTHGELSRKTPLPQGEGVMTVELHLTSRHGRDRA